MGTAVANLQSQVGTMYNSGLIPSTSSSEAQSIVDGTLPVSSMMAAINQLLKDGASSNQATWAQNSVAGQALANVSGSNSGNNSTIANNSWSGVTP